MIKTPPASHVGSQTLPVEAAVSVSLVAAVVVDWALELSKSSSSKRPADSSRFGMANGLRLCRAFIVLILLVLCRVFLIIRCRLARCISFSFWACPGTVLLALNSAFITTPPQAILGLQSYSSTSMLRHVRTLTIWKLLSCRRNE